LPAVEVEDAVVEVAAAERPEVTDFVDSSLDFS
jgi:hypothetical protein